LLLLAAAALETRALIPLSPKIIKIGLVAPFEGRYREIGDQVIPAARLALRQYLDSRVTGNPIVEIVAYDDGGNIEKAEQQARRLMSDPDVEIVIGHWRDDTTTAAVEIYGRRHIPLVAYSAYNIGISKNVYNLAPSEDQFRSVVNGWFARRSMTGQYVPDSRAGVEQTAIDFTGSHSTGSTEDRVGGPDHGLGEFYALTRGRATRTYFVTGAPTPRDKIDLYWTTERTNAFIKGFELESLGEPPGQYSTTAYEATWFAIQMVIKTGLPEDIRREFGSWRFDTTGRLIGQPAYLYQWINNSAVLTMVLR